MPPWRNTAFTAVHRLIGLYFGGESFMVEKRQATVEAMMGVGSSPKEYIKAVADGYAMMTVVSLRKFGTSEQLRVLLQYVAQLEREYRNEIIADDDFDGNRKKHFRLSNLQKARNIIMGFAKSRRIPL